MRPFNPHFLMRNAHIQTIAVGMVHPLTGITYDRHRLELADGDFMDIDVPTLDDQPLPEQAKTVLVVHGLGGEARGGYMSTTYRELAKVGLRGVGLNLRGCSGEPNRLARSYHLGSTDDLLPALAWVVERYGGPVGLMGFSLGGNLTLKLMGEQGAAIAALVKAAVAVSPPFAFHGRMRLNDLSARIYRNYLLQSLREAARVKTGLIDAAGGNAQAAASARTLGEYDRAYTAPVNGFKDEWDYYDHVTCGQFLPGIMVPTLVIRAVDDPFFYDDIPRDVLAANPAITALITRYGGHCGFIEGLREYRFWAHEVAAQWLSERLG